MIINKVFLKYNFTQSFPALARLFSSTRMKPSFFIVGFQKSGTTFLYDALLSHSNVLPGILKENNLLAEERDRLTEFRMYFPSKTKNAITGDASHLHTWMPYGAERIKKYFPKAKVLVIMRDPIERAFSHYNMDKKLGYLPESMSFEDVIDIELILRRNIVEDQNVEEVYKSTKLYGNKYGWPLSRGLYFVYLNELKRLGLEVYPVFLEKLKEDFQGEMSKVQEYLGLETEVLTDKIRNKGDYSNEMNPETRIMLQDFYRTSNQKLADLLKRPLPW